MSDVLCAHRTATGTAPARVRIVHSMVGDMHVFTSPDLDDFQVADRDLERAFGSLQGEVADIVEAEACRRVPYVLNMTYREFVAGEYSPRRPTNAKPPLFAAAASHAHIVDPHADFVPPARLRREARQRTTH
jgi:hypothetical protein